MVALTPDASNAMRAFTFCASSSIVGLTTGNVARAAYFASTASRNAVSRLWPPPRSRRFAWWNIHGSFSPAHQVAQLLRALDVDDLRRS